MWKPVLDFIPGWGWIGIGIVILITSTILFVAYAREPRDRSAMLYSIMHFAGALGLGALAIVMGIIKMSG
jgi:hypothetical protein